MPFRKVVFVNNEIYHLINRGVAQAPIFLGKNDYRRIMEIINFYRHETPSLRFSHFHRLSQPQKESFLKKLETNHAPIVEILAFCLMPNHIHLLSRQLKDRGISTFMKQVQASYALYFNTKHRRAGPLFQSVFKAVRMETDEQLLHVSRYIHLNPTSSFLIKINDLNNYPWFSFPAYLGKENLQFVETSFILNYFKDKKGYESFVFDQAEYQRELEKIKHLILE